MVTIAATLFVLYAAVIVFCAVTTTALAMFYSACESEREAKPEPPITFGWEHFTGVFIVVGGCALMAIVGLIRHL